MVHCHTVHLPLGALLTPCTMCGTGDELHYFVLKHRQMLGMVVEFYLYRDEEVSASLFSDGGGLEGAASAMVPRFFQMHYGCFYTGAMGHSGPLARYKRRGNSQGHTWCTPSPCTFP